jgi:hypothetical protein
MAVSQAFSATYDALTDVLYITKQSAQASRGVEDSQGIVWRYGPDGDIIGATVVDFVDLWAKRNSALAEQLSAHFKIPHPQAMTVLEHALDHQPH